LILLRRTTRAAFIEPFLRESIVNEGAQRHISVPEKLTNPFPEVPFDSSIRISLECRNWGIPKDAAAMVSTDSGAWVIEASEKGRV
jgi:hypothetical protein